MKFHKDGTLPEDGEIWVFGSNLAGFHGKGAALVAAQKYGATLEVAIGMSGTSFAIPTKDHRLQSLPLTVIAKMVGRFLRHAATTPDRAYWVTRVGCGLAGYSDADIAPMFAGASDNCNFAEEWMPWLDDEELPAEL